MNDVAPTPPLAERLAVYLVADPDQTTRPLIDDVAAALAGGVSCVQLRAKSLTDRESLALARRIRELCSEVLALFFMNDRVDLALASGADGVHLGVDDLPLEDARQIGRSLIIGYSPETDDQAMQAGVRGADYLGVGPVFGTLSKADAGVSIGVEAISRRVRLAGIPVIGIGGITADNAAEVIDAGAVGVATVGAILRAEHPRIASAHLVGAVRNALRAQ